MSDFNTILNRMIDTIPDSFDKRLGSLIYNALAPTAMEIMQTYVNQYIFVDQTYLGAAVAQNLDNWGGNLSLVRFPATPALRIARMYDLNMHPTNISLNSRFATPTDQGGIPFTTIERLGLGLFVLECEIPGAIGNEYTGDILPLFSANNLGRAEIVDTQKSGEDEERDEDYRERILARLNQAAFGGNISDYKEFVKAIDGVGGLKVFPVWDGGGTVLLSVVDGSYDPISVPFQTALKNLIDPTDQSGNGVGLAPIGHSVTITTPERIIINVSAKVTLDNRTIGQIQQEAEQNIASYFREVRTTWSDSNIANVFVIMVANAILKIQGVVNVTNVILNGSPADLELESTPQSQQLPYLGVVTLGT